MTIFKILIAVIIKTDKDFLKCNRKWYQFYPLNAYAQGNIELVWYPKSTIQCIIYVYGRQTWSRANRPMCEVYWWANGPCVNWQMWISRRGERSNCYSSNWSLWLRWAKILFLWLQVSIVIPNDSMRECTPDGQKRSILTI